MPQTLGTFSAVGDVSAALDWHGASFVVIQPGADQNARVVIESRVNPSAAWGEVRQGPAGAQALSFNGPGNYGLPGNPEGNRSRIAPERWQVRLRCAALPSGTLNYTLMTNGGGQP